VGGVRAATQVNRKVVAQALFGRGETPGTQPPLCFASSATAYAAGAATSARLAIDAAPAALKARTASSSLKAYAWAIPCANQRRAPSLACEGSRVVAPKPSRTAGSECGVVNYVISLSGLFLAY